MPSRARIINPRRWCWRPKRGWGSTLNTWRGGVCRQIVPAQYHNLMYWEQVVDDVTGTFMSNWCYEPEWAVDKPRSSKILTDRHSTTDSLPNIRRNIDRFSCAGQGSRESVRIARSIKGCANVATAVHILGVLAQDAIIIGFLFMNFISKYSIFFNSQLIFIIYVNQNNLMRIFNI